MDDKYKMPVFHAGRSEMVTDKEEINKWVVQFTDGTKIYVEAYDIQDALREGHREGGPKYAIADIIELKRM